MMDNGEIVPEQRFKSPNNLFQDFVLALPPELHFQSLLTYSSSEMYGLI
jgi:hypothetical protein